ncbi:MAG: sugar ABC transporter substrate-binding protein, partial [Clostridiales bacterium]|nr:sugar ABC transporter substrate-binding protein [Clostridiales bacterium]
MKKFARLFVALMMVCIMTIGVAAAEVTVGIVNNPPSESGYREANVKDFEAVFSAENGYVAKTFYSLKNDEQLSAAQQFITDGVDYLLISAAETTGWDAVLASAQENGIPVFLFDRMIDCDEELYAAAVVSDMANQGKLAVEWLIAQNLPEYKIIHIQGAMGSDAQIGRTGALDAQVAANDNWSIVVQQTATWDEAEAKKIVEAVINSKEDFNIIYAENDGM